LADGPCPLGLACNTRRETTNAQSGHNVCGSSETTNPQSGHNVYGSSETTNPQSGLNVCGSSEPQAVVRL